MPSQRERKTRKVAESSHGRDCMFWLKLFWAVELLTQGTPSSYAYCFSKMILRLAHRNVRHFSRTKFFDKSCFGWDTELVMWRAQNYFCTSTVEWFCTARLVHDDIPRWGCPHTFVSDRSPEFVSVVCQGVFKMISSVKKYTNSYHPQTNGMVETLTIPCAKCCPIF